MFKVGIRSIFFRKCFQQTVSRWKPVRGLNFVLLTNRKSWKSVHVTNIGKNFHFLKIFNMGICSCFAICSSWKSAHVTYLGKTILLLEMFKVGIRSFLNLFRDGIRSWFAFCSSWKSIHVTNMGKTFLFFKMFKVGMRLFSNLFWARNRSRRTQFIVEIRSFHRYVQGVNLFYFLQKMF
jgi:hypothetical protein